ncbi:MAG: hypothetical protein HY645_10510 [Acidobacteria bacterium]|nr:hypothetical protein [Acidobacteriota bacterium]
MKRILGALVVFFFLLGVKSSAQENDSPQKPLDLRASARFDGGMAVAVLSWSDQSTNELGFEILRSDNGSEFRVVGMVGANTSRYEDKVGKYVTGAFTYIVKAFNEAGKSADSNSASCWF